MIIKKIPWKALLILAIGMVIAFPLGAKYGHNITWLTTEKTLNTKSVNEALNKPTTSNTTTNQVNVGKVKKADSLTIIFDPKTDQKAVTNIVEPDTCFTISVLKEMSIKDIRKLRREKNKPR